MKNDREQSGEGKFSFEAGSYGVPELVYMPSILCRKRVSRTRWRNHFVLVNTEQVLVDEESASGIAAADLDEAFENQEKGGTEVDVAICLKAKGYKSIKDFKIVKDEGVGE